MYNITFKGYFETEKAEEFIELMQELMAKTETKLIGNQSVYELPKFVDYQKCEDGN